MNREQKRSTNCCAKPTDTGVLRQDGCFAESRGHHRSMVPWQGKTSSLWKQKSLENCPQDILQHKVQSIPSIPRNITSYMTMTIVYYCCLIMSDLLLDGVNKNLRNDKTLVVFLGFAAGRKRSSTWITGCVATSSRCISWSILVHLQVLASPKRNRRSHIKPEWNGRLGPSGPQSHLLPRSGGRHVWEPGPVLPVTKWKWVDKKRWVVCVLKLGVREAEIWWIWYDLSQHHFDDLDRWSWCTWRPREICKTTTKWKSSRLGSSQGEDRAGRHEIRWQTWLMQSPEPRWMEQKGRAATERQQLPKPQCFGSAKPPPKDWRSA